MRSPVAGWRRHWLRAMIWLPMLFPLGCVPAQAETGARVLPAVRALEAPTIDGRIDEPGWQTAAVAAGFIDPFTGKPAPDQTEARLMYDDQALYVAFHCRDSRPEGIVAREIRYGAAFQGEDTIGFLIDPFNRRTMDGISHFNVNAIGTQNDAIAAGRAAKREWRGVWRAAVARVPDGWTAEIRIPWEMLTYPDADRPMPMTLNFTRFQARTHITSFWSNVTPAGRGELMGTWQDVTPPRRPRARPLQTLVYAAPEWREGDNDEWFRAGADLRYTPTPQTAAVLSILPDFRNIEQAIEGIEFTRAERMVEETRPFFLEGGGHFPDLFYSRRVGEFDVGAKVFGNLRPDLSFGVLSLLDDRRSNISVGQIRFSMAERGAIALAGTLRRGGDPEHDAFGASGFLRQGNWRVMGDWSRAREGPFGGHRGSAVIMYQVPRISANIGYSMVDPTYRPSLGYVDFTNQRGFSAGMSYDNEFRSGPLRAISTGFGLQRTTHYDGRVFQEGGAARLMVTTRNDMVIGMGPEVMRFHGTTDRVLNTAINGNVSNRFRRWALGYSFGTRAGHAMSFLNFGLTQRVFGRMDVGLNGSILRHVQRREQYIATVGWEFDALRSMNARMVLRDERVNWYLSFRSSGGVGQDLYLIVGDPNAPRFASRLALKWVMAL
ncbi:MAG TPA: carbohydrate binding family 9 domain-containing protein [Chthonomonadales bacterium]|nr:carbohydrate binding family 9 domain-containing protein [Chthonomonadales bacterium]